jgi:hypothetical protein
MARETTRHRDELATDQLGDEGSSDLRSERGDPAKRLCAIDVRTAQAALALK